jgi:hypothetical protein
MLAGQILGDRGAHLTDGEHRDQSRVALMLHCDPAASFERGHHRVLDRAPIPADERRPRPWGAGGNARENQTQHRVVAASRAGRDHRSAALLDEP